MGTVVQIQYASGGIRGTVTQVTELFLPWQENVNMESVMGSVCWRSVPTRHVPHRSGICKKEDFFGLKPTPN